MVPDELVPRGTVMAGQVISELRHCKRHAWRS
jgi:hypothetical protein